MRKALFFTLVLSMAVVAAIAQKPADFSGKWTLDVAKSKLGERSNIESQTLTVTQTATDIKIETATKRMAPPAGAPAGGPGGGGRGFGGGGDMPMTYALDGKETKIERQGPQGPVPVTLKAVAEGNKLVLTQSSTFNGPNGEVTFTTKETWELGTDGKSLSVTTERTSFRGTDTSTRAFTKG
jgi:hypothetical protein